MLIDENYQDIFDAGRSGCGDEFAKIGCLFAVLQVIFRVLGIPGRKGWVGPASFGSNDSALFFRCEAKSTTPGLAARRVASEPRS
jgi:hypothetical protein